MKKENTTLPDRIVFFSDAHLGMPGDTEEHVERVAAFLRSLEGRVSHIYILGDLFDFWFEYASVVPNIAPSVVLELYNLVRSGVEITLFCGNHDYWLGPYLTDSIGLSVVEDGKVVEHQGRRLYMHHGDGLYPDDHGYRILKKVLRSKISIFLFRLLHPDFARKLAMISSKSSRTLLAPPKKDEIFAELFRKIADERLHGGYDAVIYGHSHVKMLEKREKGIMVLLGDWVRHNSYLVLEEGEFELHDWAIDREAGNG